MTVKELYTAVNDSPYLWPALTGLLVTCFLISKYLTYRRLSHFKGPFWANWSELWVAKITYDGKINTAFRDLSEKYGSVARAGPNLLVTNDIHFLTKISSPRSRYVRSEWNQAMKLDYRLDNTISELDENRHAELRYKLNPGYSGKDIPSREVRVAERVEDFINLIEREYISTSKETKIMDLARTAQFFTLDTITDMAFGYPFGFLEANDDLHDYISSVGALMPFFELQGNVTWFAALTGNNIARKLMAPKANDGSAFGKMIGVSQTAVKKRYEAGAEAKEDMLASFMKRGITQLEAESEALLQVLAGADSSATAIRMILYLVITNPRVYTRLQAELDSANLSWPVVTDAESRSLPYLQAVLKEGLRAWPPAAGIATKYVPPEGELLEDGRFIPGGTRVAWSAWGTVHNKEIYGDDAHYFRPERWLEAKGEKLEKMERAFPFLFGSGRTSCLGQTLAILEMNKVIPTLLRRFDISVLDPTVPFKSSCNGFFTQSGIFVRVTRRER